MRKITKFAAEHKIISLIILAIVLFGGYEGYQSFFGVNTAEAHYVLSTVQRGTLVTSVSGTGQISASNQFDVKPNASGNVVYLGVSQGQKVDAGTLIAQIDTTDAEKAVRDAEVNLQAAQLSLQQLQLSSANTDQLLGNAFSSISNTFLDLPGIISDAEQIISSDDLNPKNQANSDYYKNFVSQNDDVNSQKINLLVDSALSDYAAARTDYDAAFLDYKNTSRYADQATIETLLQSSIKSATSMAQALKSEQNILDFLIDYSSNYTKKLPTTVTTYKATLKTDIGLVDSHLTDLTNVYNSIQNAPLDVQAQQLSIQQKENALADAKDNLANYYVRAPFSGIIAELDIVNGDSVSAGTAIATMVNYQNIAEISLNEVDVSKVKIGQKATLTFDALPDLTLTGKVIGIDTIGTVTQGVVTYNVKIAIDANNASIKPGMSVSASIITEVKNDVLLVPNSAVKASGSSSYVQVFNSSSTYSAASSGQGVVSAIPPSQVQVVIGDSNDSVTEITSGLNEGDTIVTQTIAGSSQTQAQSSAAFRIPGIGGGRVGG
ncbi:MAG TPA: efflux RND transporter periplasmic adaptor subunit [Candidatus Paceibacterota bacterium]|nr:efflux RND transporter periplasmic adaptor subunit [Candidatus Paceibacterota bacterium]